MRSVLVVGGGIAGTAAALAAARTGARVALLDGGTGASTLATGALDDTPWTHEAHVVTPVTPGARAALDALAAFAVPEAGALLATTAGVVRPARGHDLALLDLTPWAGRAVGVVSCDRPGWDAASLARAWGDGFTPMEATVLRHADERRLPAADFAARHDDPSRLAWLAERLREALSRAGRRFDALVLPPSLGMQMQRAHALSQLVGVPCGEAACSPGGPSGLRFENARDRALATAGIERTSARAVGVERHGDRWRVVRDGGPPVDAHAVVLAVGGLVGGGLEYSPGDAAEASVLPPAARPPFRLTVALAEARLGAHGRPIEVPGSLFGIPPESLAWPFASGAVMDRIGLLVGEDGRIAPGLYAAGEVVADAPRTWLRALDGGARAGAAAARDTLISAEERPPSPSVAPASQP